MLRHTVIQIDASSHRSVDAAIFYLRYLVIQAFQMHHPYSLRGSINYTMIVLSKFA